MKKIVFGVILLLLLSTTVSAQDKSMVGIAENLQWEYEVTKDSKGNFRISASDEGAVAKGETYTFTITSLEDSGAYEFEYENANVRAAGSSNLGIFGADPNAIYTDWTYWEANIEDTDLFDGLSGVKTTNTGGVFTASFSLGDAEIKIEYFTETGVLKSSYISDGTDELEIVNITGAHGEEVSGFGMFIVIFSIFIASTIVRRKLA
jgi:hypothetical protein